MPVDPTNPFDVPEDHIFVFGSNKAGRHGKGAALWALQYRGAIYGKGEGLQGRSYAIPTKTEHLYRLPLDQIYFHVREFLQFAYRSAYLRFWVSPIGTGLAGYSYQDIGPMFYGYSSNVHLPVGFERYLHG